MSVHFNRLQIDSNSVFENQDSNQITLFDMEGQVSSTFNFVKIHDRVYTLFPNGFSFWSRFNNEKGSLVQLEINSATLD